MILPKSFNHYLFGIFLFGATVSYGADFIERGQLSPPDRPFSQPQAIAIGGDGTVYVIDTGNNRLVAFNQRGRHLKSIGGFGFEADQFDHPFDIWAGSLINLYISDYNNDRVQRYDRGLNYLSTRDGSKVEGS